MSIRYRMLFFLFSLLLVSFGQAAWSRSIALIAAAGGYALFFRLLIDLKEAKMRFYWGTIWFGTVQLIQLSWLLSHPYLYIWGGWLFFSGMIGIQFGLLSLLFSKQKITSLSRILSISCFWVLMEWSRLFFLVGYTWNPIGLALAADRYPLQMASLFGVYGLSFWLLFTNLLALRAWLLRSPSSLVLWITAAGFPYLFGAIQLSSPVVESTERFNTLLVQTAFPCEEGTETTSCSQWVESAKDRWKQIIALASDHIEREVSLVILPEFAVPFGTYPCIYLYEDTKEVFHKQFGLTIESAFPVLEWPWAQNREDKWYVNNAFWAQTLANHFNAGVVVGLSDAEQNSESTWKYYSSAIYIQPTQPNQTIQAFPRYAKRILVPLGEYIPFSWCKHLAARYGVTSSFTPGNQATVWRCGKTSFAPSICYEETFGNLIRESRLLGAHLLINLTNDGWYPNSRLPKQHLEHARLRAVENGVSLARACNTGVTCVIDPFGRELAALGEEESAALWASFPIKYYRTLYAYLGDAPIIGLSLLWWLLALRRGSY